MTEDIEDEVGAMAPGEYGDRSHWVAAQADGRHEVPVGELGYAAASMELDAIIGELDQGVVDVDVLDVRFRRAIEIVEELDRRIRGARERVSALAPRLEAIGAEPAEPAAPGLPRRS